MRQLVVIAHDIRSCHNVGALLRTAEGLGVSCVYLTGYTPYPTFGKKDKRLPHIKERVSKQIHKTALGAEASVNWLQADKPLEVIHKLRKMGYQIVGLEQAKEAVELMKYQPSAKIALIIGREVEGMDSELLASCDQVVSISMYGSKESFNVIEATSMALFHLRFAP